MAKLLAFLNGHNVGEIQNLDPAREYWIGRQQGSDLIITGARISRKHLRLAYENGRWTLSSASRFAKFEAGAPSESSAELVDGIDIQVSGFVFRLEDPAAQETPRATARPEPNLNLSLNMTLSSESSESKKLEMDSSGPRTPPPPPPRTPKVEEEATRIAPKAMQASLRIVSREEDELIVPLDDRSMVIGRAPDCQIVLDEPRASRTHLKISNRSGRFFATDLGSSNGTLVNGRGIPENSPVELNSGDEILIGSTYLYFEVRDPSFDARIFHAPVASAPRPMGHRSHPHFPPRSGPQPLLSRLFSHKTMEGRVFLGLLAVVFAYGLFSGNEKPEKGDFGSNPTTPGLPQPAPGDNNLAQLTPEQKILIENTYRLAKQYAYEGRYEAALIEFKKLHQLIPEYQDSRQLQNQAERFIEIKTQQEEIERRKKDALELREKVRGIVEDCQKKANSGASLVDVQDCLGRALELDPENQGAQQLIERVTAQQAARDRAQAQQRQAQANIRGTLALLTQAQEADNRRDFRTALGLYERVANSEAPIPQDARAKAKERLASVKQKLDAEVQNLISQAETHLGQNDFKSALDKVTAVLKQSPQNPKAIEIREKASGELYKKLKGLYGDSVLEENLGNVEAAKQKWKSILQMDAVNGEYYLKARQKLKKYGEIQEVDE